MLLQSVKSQGLSHISYILGDGGYAAVIDPRRDCRVYLDIACKNGMQITHIFETHRNEDYIIGSQELSAMTGAAVYHGKALDFTYGQAAVQGDVFEFGQIRLKILETPGHTFESLSLVLYDTGSGEEPLAVFTGDALFIGDVGRTDFFPDRLEETAGLLYDSIFTKLLPLGDQEDFTLLDVRSLDEFEQGHLPNAQHIFLGELPERLGEIGSSRPVTTFCGSGQRAIIAASILKQNGFREVEDCLGSMQACARGVCEIMGGEVE